MTQQINGTPDLNYNKEAFRAMYEALEAQLKDVTAREWMACHIIQQFEQALALARRV